MLLCRWPLYTIVCTILQVLVKLRVDKSGFLLKYNIFIYLFISLFLSVYLKVGAWLDGCFKEQSISNLSACMLTYHFPLLPSYLPKRASDVYGTARVLLKWGMGGHSPVIGGCGRVWEQI